MSESHYDVDRIMDMLGTTTAVPGRVAATAGGGANSSVSAEFRRILVQEGSTAHFGDTHLNGDPEDSAPRIHVVSAVEHCLRALEAASNTQLEQQQRLKLDATVFASHPCTVLSPALMTAIAKAAVGEEATMSPGLASVLLAVTAGQVRDRRLRVCGFCVCAARPPV
jgi:hypothetical protein